MGVHVVEARRGFAAATVPVDGNGNHFGVIYAGVQFTVAEILGGIISLSTFDSAKYFPLVKNLDISFVGMARSRAAGARPVSTTRRSPGSKPRRPNAASPTSPSRRPSPMPTGKTVATTRGPVSAARDRDLAVIA